MRIVVVDESDNIIGFKEPSRLEPEDIYRVARLVVINSNGQILLAQRAFSKQKDPGVWGLAVEGTVEEGEDYESNIRKEAKEEIGVTLGSIEPGPKIRISGKYNQLCQFFVYRADLLTEELVLQTSELNDVKWFDADTLRQEIVEMPEKFGYNFDHIMDAIWPLLKEAYD